MGARLEALLRRENMTTCHTLYRLDARTERQTRFLLSIDATTTPSSLSPWHRLAEFCHLLGRVFTSSPQGEPGLLWHLDDLYETTQEVSAPINDAFLVPLIQSEGTGK